MKNDRLRAKVREAYSAAADNPEGNHAFPVGEKFALSLGYPETLLGRMPGIAKQAFAGVSNVSLLAPIPKGSTVLDLGCGAGLDSLVACERTGPNGSVIGSDFSWSMLRRAAEASREVDLPNLILCQSDAEDLPLPDRSIDVALVNGLLNLNPAREAIFLEVARVLRTDGLLCAAELILIERHPQPDPQDESTWFA